MTLSEAIAVLEAHNRWRRHDGDESPDAMGDPRQIGQAIDIVTVRAGQMRAALARLHGVCGAMDLENEARRPTEDEYAFALEMAGLALESAGT